MKNAYQQIKNFVRTHQNSAVLISRTDSFLGEYYPPEAKRLSAVSGFTGSAGLAFIDSVQDVLFVDSRYTVQAKKQSSFQVFEVPTQTTPCYGLLKTLKEKPFILIRKRIRYHGSKKARNGYKKQKFL